MYSTRAKHCPTNLEESATPKAPPPSISSSSSSPSSPGVAPMSVSSVAVISPSLAGLGSMYSRRSETLAWLEQRGGRGVIRKCGHHSWGATISFKTVGTYTLDRSFPNFWTSQASVKIIPPRTMLARHKMTIVPQRVINIDYGAEGNLGNCTLFSCSANFIKKMPTFCKVSQHYNLQPIVVSMNLSTRLYHHIWAVQNGLIIYIRV